MLYWGMSNGDAGVPLETEEAPVGKDLGKEFDNASGIGRLVVSVVKERTENPKFSVRRYSFPMLDSGKFPQDAISAIAQKSDPSEVDVKAAMEGSLRLAIESAAQIVYARPVGSKVAEDPESLENMGRVIRRSAGFLIQTEAADSQLVIRAGREVLTRREGARGLEDMKGWDDSKVLDWSKGVFRAAGTRLQRSIAATESYNNTRI